AADSRRAVLAASPGTVVRPRVSSAGSGSAAFIGTPDRRKSKQAVSRQRAMRTLRSGKENERHYTGRLRLGAVGGSVALSLRERGPSSRGARGLHCRAPSRKRLQFGEAPF